MTTTTVTRQAEKSRDSGLRSLVVEQFQAEHADAIAEWMKHIARIDADLVMFMARKSYCIYDLFRSLGYEGTQLPVVTDRILGQSLEPLKGLRIALVDDTVILGTTLRAAKRTLEDAGAEVSVHALAVDQDNFNSDNVRIDYFTIGTSDEATRILCAAEVRALGLLPRPYLVDFPISPQIRIRRAGCDALLDGLAWSGYNLSSEYQSRSGARIYTFFPTVSTRDRLSQLLGVDVARCVDLAKVRAFGRQHGDSLRLTFVPLVTLRPMSVQGLELMIDGLLERLGIRDQSEISELTQALASGGSRFRLAQYIISLLVGEVFFGTLAQREVIRPDVHFSDREAHVHFGGWHHKALMKVAAACADRVASPHLASNALDLEKCHPVALPEVTATWSESFLDDRDFRDSQLRLSSDRLQPRTGVVEIDMAESFLALFERYELRARAENHQRKGAELPANPEALGFSGRLSRGLPWRSIANHLARTYGLPAIGPVRNRLSLSLDRLNDLGVAVPIVCEESGVVYRAYRHGEDVKWMDAESDLVYHMIDGMLSGSGWNSIPRVALEKTLVTLISTGERKRWLASGRPEATSGVPLVSLTSHLHGRVAVIRDDAGGPRHDEMLREYLTSRGVLTLSPDGYRLGEKLDGTQASPEAPKEAFTIGWLFGRLITNDDDADRGRSRGLTDGDLVALTTCRNAHLTLDAVLYELAHASNWWRGRVNSYGNGCLASREASESALQALRRSDARIALNSAVMKFDYWSNQRWREVVRQGSERLERHSVLEARTWQALWASTEETQNTAEEQPLIEALDQAAVSLWNWLLAMAAIETALVANIHTGKKLMSEWSRVEQRIGSQKRKLEQTESAIRQPGDFDRIDGVLRSGDWNRQRSVDLLMTGRDAIRGLGDHASIDLHNWRSVIRTYGKVSSVKRYPFVLWYDIVDSRGNRYAHERGDVENYRRRVSEFRKAVDKILEHYAIMARRKSGDLRAWDGEVGSRNDAKHIATEGEHAHTWIVQILREMSDARHLFPDVLFRAILADAAFAGPPLERRLDDGVMTGDACLEHLSQLQHQLRARDADYRHDCPVLLVGNSMTSKDVQHQLRLSGVLSQQMITNVAGRELRSQTVLGALPRQTYSQITGR